MGRVIPINTRGGKEPDMGALTRQVDDVARQVNQLSFGEPQKPDDPTSAVLAGGDNDGTWAATDHNGTPGNLEGSWVEVALEDTGPTDITCTHNLFGKLDNAQYTVPVSGEPNCRWIPFGVMHDGTASDTSTRLKVSVAFVGGTVTVNAIDLRFSLEVSGTTPTIGSSNPVLVSLFFVKASRGE
jgi:hypothetical protein